RDTSQTDESVRPGLVGQWRLVEDGLEVSPVRKVPVHHLNKGVVVVGLDQVSELVYDEVLDAAGRLLRELEVEQDPPGPRAGTPLRFHATNPPLQRLDAHLGFPLGDQGLEALAK